MICTVWGSSTGNRPFGTWEAKTGGGTKTRRWQRHPRVFSIIFNATVSVAGFQDDGAFSTPEVCVIRAGREKLCPLGLWYEDKTWSVFPSGVVCCTRKEFVVQRAGRIIARLVPLVIGCLRFTKLWWIGKHVNIFMKPMNSPTQGQQPNPRKKRLRVAFGPLFSHSKNIFSWVGIGFI